MLSNPHPNVLRPVESNEFLPKINRWLALGGLLIVGAGGIAIVLSAVTKYNVTISALAAVRPTGELRLVQPAVAGTVVKIHVKENQLVKQGEAIATIDDSSLQTKKSQLVSNNQWNQKQLIQINAQLGALDSQIVAETQLMERAVTAATEELNRIQREYTDRLATTRSEATEVEANVQAALASWQKAQSDLRKEQQNLQTVAANLLATQADLKLAQARWNRYRPLASSGAISFNQLDEAQQAVVKQEQALKGQQSALEAQRQVVEGQQRIVEEQQQAVLMARAKLERAKALLYPSAAPVAIATARIDQERNRGKATLAALAKEKQALSQRSLEMQNLIDRDSKELQQIESDLTKGVIVAPTDGSIVKINLRNPGQQVQRGEVVAQILPSNVSLVIKALVKTQDRDKVERGQAVQMRVDSCPYPNFGTLKGSVQAISADAVALVTTNPNASATPTPQSGGGAEKGAFYEVTIQPKTTFLVQGERQCTIQPGMEGRADIISREETVLQFVLRKARLLTDF